MKTLADAITLAIKKIGDVGSLLLLVIMGVMTYEVIARYVFNSPTSWAWVINKQLFGVYVMIAGGYALVHNSHIRIELFYQRFSPAAKTAVHWLSLVAALCFLTALTWKSG